MDPGVFFAGNPVGLATFERVLDRVRGLGPVDVEVTRSQVAFRRRHGFAYLWQPRQYLRRGAPVVLSIALGRCDPSPRFKEVAHPTPRHWIHHLEVSDPAAIDDEVAAWLAEAASRAE